MRAVKLALFIFILEAMVAMFADLGIPSPAAVSRESLEAKTSTSAPSSQGNVLTDALAYVWGLLQSLGFFGKLITAILFVKPFLQAMFFLPEPVAWALQTIIYAIYTVSLIEILRGMGT